MAKEDWGHHHVLANCRQKLLNKMGEPEKISLQPWRCTSLKLVTSLPWKILEMLAHQKSLQGDALKRYKTKSKSNQKSRLVSNSGQVSPGLRQRGEWCGIRWNRRFASALLIIKFKQHVGLRLGWKNSSNTEIHKCDYIHTATLPLDVSSGCCNS